MKRRSKEGGDEFEMGSKTEILGICSKLGFRNRYPEEHGFRREFS